MLTQLFFMCRVNAANHSRLNQEEAIQNLGTVRGFVWGR